MLLENRLISAPAIALAHSHYLIVANSIFLLMLDCDINILIYFRVLIISALKQNVLVKVSNSFRSGYTRIAFGKEWFQQSPPRQPALQKSTKFNVEPDWICTSQVQSESRVHVASKQVGLGGGLGILSCIKAFFPLWVTVMFINVWHHMNVYTCTCIWYLRNI